VLKVWFSLPDPPPTLLSSMATSSSNFQSILDVALNGSHKHTGIDLTKHPTAAQLQNCQAPDDVVQLLLERETSYHHSPYAYAHSSPTRIAFAASPSSPSHPPLFLSTSSPSSPRSSHRFIFCLRRLSIRPPSLAVAANARHLRFDHLAPARCARPCASRIPAQDHALKDTVVTSYRTHFFTFSVCFIVTLSS